jgi:DNA-binding FadR family transcriptional regulator
LVEVRRGSRTGAKARVPGPEIVARPGVLLLAISGTTLADVMTARIGLEPYAARLLADDGSDAAHEELRRLVSAISRVTEAGAVAHASAKLHSRLVELSGNATLTMIAGMLHEISERHTTAAILRDQNAVPKTEYAKLLRSYDRLAMLVSERKGAEAEAHWRRHMENPAALCSRAMRRRRCATFGTDRAGPNPPGGPSDPPRFRRSVTWVSRHSKPTDTVWFRSRRDEPLRALDRTLEER